jgi:dipeptidyl aminopeptidase/acylaminoacyl peptidase
VRGLFAFLDPLLGRPTLVVEADDGATRERHVRHDEPERGEQPAGIVLDVRNDSARRRPTVRLVPEALVPNQGLATRTSARAKEDVLDRQFQGLVGGYADHVFHVALVERVVDLGLGGTPRRLGLGNGPLPSPRGQRVACVQRRQIWSTDLGSIEAPAQLVNARGNAAGLAWSPDGSMLAFTSNRGTHSYIGAFTLATRELRYLDSSLDRDGNAAWSPDGIRIAWIRQRAAPRARMFSPRRQVDEPWFLRVADVKSGQGQQVWKADSGYGSAFQAVVSDKQLYWADGDRLVFPMGEERLGPPVFSRSGWRQGDTADAGQLRSRVREHHARSHPHDLQLEPGRHRSASRMDGAGLGFRADEEDGEDERQRVAAGDHQRWQHGAGARRCADAAARDPHLVRRPRAQPAGEHAAARIRPVLLVRPQPVMIIATDGMEIPSQLFLPRDLKPGERRPAVIFFHGGSRRQMLVNWHYNYYYRNAYAMNQWLASQGYIVLSVNYRSGIGYGLEFREALNYGASGGAEFNDVVGAGYI